MLSILKSGFNSVISFLFKKSPVFKTIVAFLIAVACFTIAYYTYIEFLWYAGLVFIGYVLIMFLIGMAYAWVINPIRDKKMRR